MTERGKYSDGLSLTAAIQRHIVDSLEDGGIIMNFYMVISSDYLGDEDILLEIQ